MVTDIISPMLLWVATTIQDGQDLPDVVLNPIGYLIVLFASLIYNEIIILNFCNLSKDTKKFVELRLNEEKDDLRKTKIGKVVSNKMDKTVVVRIDDREKDPLYGKIVNKTLKVKAHDENNECSIGDIVEIMETRPLSKDKRYRLVRIVEKVK